MFFNKTVQNVLFIWLSLVLLTTAANSQQLSNLRGLITDPSGDFVVGAKIVIIGEKELERNTKTDRSGFYMFDSLPAGSYRLRIDSKGFELFESKKIVIAVGQTHTFNAALKIKRIEASVGVNPDSLSDSDPNRNSDKIVLKDEEIEDLPDDPVALADALRALAPPGPGEPQIYVDGFLVQGPPPKESIREVRISSNTFSAENDRASGGRIDIFTKIGLDKLRGSVFFNVSDEILNARNPLSDERAPFGYKRYGFSLGGTIVPKRLSFFLNLQRLDEDQNAVVNAQTLSPELSIEPLNLSFPVPRRNTSFSPRLDFQINDNHSLSLRYRYSDTDISNLGVGEISLPERGYGYSSLQNTFRLTETAVLNSQTVNETRFQFVRSEIRRLDTSISPTLNVQGAFLGGSAGFGNSLNTADWYELQNYTTKNTANHLIRFGVRLRWVDRVDNAPNNFNGTYTFAGGAAPVIDGNGQIVSDGGQFTQLTSLERFQRTLFLQMRNFTPEEIRLRGGGASQFSIAQGDPAADASQFDVGVFFQDEWRLRPNFNLYSGIRYETQTNIDDKTNFGPRLAFAWVPKFGKNRNTTIRGGAGLYYERFGESNLIQARRFDGIRQQRFISSDTALLDSFPNIPTPQELSGFAGEQIVTRIADNIQAARLFSSLIGFTHRLSPNTSFTAGLSTYRARHRLRRRNINAPLSGTFVFGQPDSGIRPFGNTGEIFLIESSNDAFQNQFYFGFRSRINSRISLLARYLLSDTKDGGSSGSFPADSNDLSGEFGRSSRFSIRHRFYLNGTFRIPKLNISLSPGLVAFSQRPFNITTGLDTNGDQRFMERPSLATNIDLSNPDIVQTEFGVFNINPQPGEEIISRNIGRGPAFLSINMGIRKTFGFGSDGSKKSRSGRSSGKPYRTTFSVQIQNLFNQTNLGTPVGNLSSPLFGRSTSTTGANGFENGNPSYNRRIEVQIRFNF